MPCTDRGSSKAYFRMHEPDPRPQVQPSPSALRGNPSLPGVPPRPPAAAHLASAAASRFARAASSLTAEPLRETAETMRSPKGDTSFMSSDTSRVRVFTALHDIAVAIGGVLEPVELARLVVNRARELLEAGAVGVYSLDESTQLLEPIYSSDAREALPEPAIPIGTGAAGQALLRGQ